MQINATFVIQIFNFWITYIVLHKLFFKQAVALIEKKNATNAQALERLKTMNTSLLKLQDNKKKQLVDFKQYLKTRYQPPKKIIDEIPAEAFIIKSQEEIELLIIKTKIFLTDKVPPCLLK